ncbi:MAG TPA: hypothetical protein VFC58_11335 [Desulfosporosinus sp.]|nr:hypothetical protein [Desulfosporosinus sp.]
MHIGHNEDDMDHENLALRHLGEGIVKERAGELQEALNEYMMAHVLDPRLEMAQTKIAELREKMDL